MSATHVASSTPMPSTLADAILPRAARPVAAAVRVAALVVGGAALTAAAAQIAFSVPWTPIPYTGQTAAVLLVGTVLGLRLGAASMLLYVLAGSLGLPLYAGGAHGIGQLLGATGGYLVGFVLAAAAVGWLAQRGWDRSPLRAAGLMAAGNLVIYALGVPVLIAVLGLTLADAVWAGAAVFLPWDAAKVAVAALALPLAWRVVGARRGRSHSTR